MQSRIIPLSTASVANLGTIGHYLAEDSTCVEKQKISVAISVQIPNGEIINSTRRVLLPNTALTRKVREAHIFPGLKNRDMHSIGTFLAMDASLFLITTSSKS